MKRESGIVVVLASDLPDGVDVIPVGLAVADDGSPVIVVDDNLQVMANRVSAWYARVVDRVDADETIQ